MPYQLILSVFSVVPVDGLMLQPRYQDICQETHCKVGGVIGSKANMHNQGFNFAMVSPGIQPVFSTDTIRNFITFVYSIFSKQISS